MISSGLFSEVKSRPIVLVVAVILHVVLIALLSTNLSNSKVHKPAGSTKKTVQAVIVDVAKVEAESKKLKQVKDDKKKKELAENKKLKREQEKAKKKLADIKKKQVTENKRLADLKKKNLAEKKRIEVQKKKSEAKKKKLAAEKKKAEADRKQAEKKKAEAEKKKKQALNAKRKADEEKRRQDEAAELQRKMLEEERLEKDARLAAEHNARLESLRSQYVRLIEQKVERNWLRPATSTSNMSCEVIVIQTSLGDVIDVVLKKCVDDLAFQRSIERAVRKASPLPPPPNPEVFDREIHFTFKPRS